MPNLDHVERAARRKLGASSEWLGFRYEAVNGGYIVEGAIPKGVITKGPRKGKPKWPGEGDKVVLSTVEVEAEITNYEEMTGNCAECLGTREVFESWSLKDGLKKRPCDFCAETGRVPNRMGGS